VRILDTAATERDAAEVIIKAADEAGASLLVVTRDGEKSNQVGLGRGGVGADACAAPVCRSLLAGPPAHAPPSPPRR
jgi:hypothetical protein